MIAIITFNRKAAADTNCDGLEFVLTTTLCPQRKDTNDVFYHEGRLRRK